MADAKDHHGITVNAVSNDVGVSAHQLAQSSTGNGTPAVREIHEAIAFIAQRYRNKSSGTRVEIDKVIIGTLDFPGRGSGPDDTHKDQTSGGGTLSPLASLVSHSHMRS